VRSRRPASLRARYTRIVPTQRNNNGVRNVPLRSAYIVNSLLSATATAPLRMTEQRWARPALTDKICIISIVFRGSIHSRRHADEWCGRHAQFTSPDRHDKTVLSVSCLVRQCELCLPDKCVLRRSASGGRTALPDTLPYRPDKCDL